MFFFLSAHFFFFASKCWYRRTEEQVCTFLHVVSNDWQHVIWLSCDHILRMSCLLFYCIGQCRPLQKFIMQHFSVVFLPWPTSALPEEHWVYSAILWWEESVFFTGMVMCCGSSAPNSLSKSIYSEHKMLWLLTCFKENHGFAYSDPAMLYELHWTYLGELEKGSFAHTHSFIYWDLYSLVL